MPRGAKIDNKKIAEIVASYALTNNYSKTARATGVCANSVKNIIEKQKNENTEEYEKVCEEKKELFSSRANRIINKSLDLIEERIDTAKKNQDELEEIIQMVLEQDKKNLNETQKKAIVNKIAKMQLNSLSELTTAMGTLYDKMRLANGESTENNKFEVNIKVVE